MEGLPLVVVVAFALVVALQWFGVIKGWQNARRLRAKTSWSEVPWPGRILAAVAAVVGLIGGVLLAMAAQRGRQVTPTARARALGDRRR